MTPTTSQPFTLERTYDAPVAKVWKALTDKAQMKQWYFDVSDFKAEPGFEFTFNGTGHDGTTYKHLCKILEVIPEKRLSYSWQYEGLQGYSVLSFELFAEGNKTRLKLVHTGLETFPQNNKDFARESFSEGWTFITGKNLAEFLEKK